MKRWLQEHIDDASEFLALLLVVIVLQAMTDRARELGYASGVQAEADRIASEALGG